MCFRRRWRGFLISLSVVAFGSGIYAVVLLADIRAQVLFLYLKNLLNNADTAAGIENAEQFYGGTVPILQRFMASLAVAMELSGGLALHALVESARAKQPVRDHSRRLTEIDEEIAHVAGSLTACKNAAATYHAEARRKLHLIIMRRLRWHADVLRNVGCAIILFLLTSSCAYATDTVVTLVDASASQASKDYSGITNFQRNLDALNAIVPYIPAGTRFMVLAITAESFGRPAVWVDRTIPTDSGPLSFLNKIDVARQEIQRDLRRTAAAMRPDSRHTDIFGALAFAADLMSRATGKKTMYIFSDLRQSTSEIDLEHTDDVPVQAALAKAAQLHLIPRLEGVDVYALGVDGTGKRLAYWQALREFWTEYFKRAGANLRRYSVARGLVK